MKKIVNIMYLGIILLLFYLTRNKDILTLSVSFSMYFLFGSLFSTIKMESKNYKLFKLCLLSIIIIGLGITGISYVIGDVMGIDKLAIVNVFMAISLISNIILRLFGNYLNIIKYNKNNVKIINFSRFMLLFVKLLSIIVIFGVIRVEDYIRVILFYSVDIFVLLAVIIMLYFNFFRKIKDINSENISVKNIKNIIIGDSVKVIYNVIRSSYIYISIVVLYYILCNRYNYSYSDVSNVITNNYFYGVIVVYYIYKCISKYINIDVRDDFNNNVNRLMKLVLPMMVILIILSKPISYILVGNDYNVLANMIPLLGFYVIYDFVISNILYYNKKKNIIIALVSGLIINILFKIPLIDTVCRMGYTLELGSVLSIVLGMIFSIILGVIYLKKKKKINLHDNFNGLLNIIYENIIYTLIIVLCTLVVDVNTNGFLSGVLAILFYIFVSIIFYIIKRKITSKNK